MWWLVFGNNQYVPTCLKISLTTVEKRLTFISVVKVRDMITKTLRTKDV